MSEPPGRVVKAVLDSSVVLRGISSAGGPSGRIVDAFFNGAFNLVLSLEIVAEVEEALRRGRIPAIPPIDDRLRGEIMTALAIRRCRWSTPRTSSLTFLGSMLQRLEAHCPEIHRDTHAASRW